MSGPWANHWWGTSCRRDEGKVPLIKKKKRVSAGKISPKAPPVWGEEGKYFFLLLLVPAAPPASPLVLEGSPTTSQVSQDHRLWVLLGGQHHPRALSIAQALGVTAPPGQAKAVCNPQPQTPACTTALLAAQTAAGQLKSVVSKVGDFTRQARGTFEMAVKHMAEFQFSLCF